MSSIYHAWSNIYSQQKRHYKSAFVCLIQLRIIDATGAEKFAEYLYHKLNEFVQEETNGRVQVVQVEFMEHNKNTAIYGE